MDAATLARDMIARDMIARAEAERMDSLLAAWQREIAAEWEALKEKDKAIEAEKVAAADAAARQRAIEFQEARQLDSYASELEGLAVRADDAFVSIPSPPPGVRAASLALAGPPIGALLGQIQAEAVEEALDPDNDGRIGTAKDEIAAAQKATARIQAPAARTEVTEIDSPEMHSARWALGHGLVPHPGDLGAIMERAQIDAPWKQQFVELAMSLDKISSVSNGQLRGHLSHNQMDLLQRQVQLMSAYGSDRLLKLVTNPGGLGGSASPAVPSTVGRPGGIASAGFNQMLDTLGWGTGKGSVTTR